MTLQSEKRAPKRASGHHATDNSHDQLTRASQNEMADDIHSWVEAIRQQQNLKELFQLSVRIARDLGYDFFAINERGLTMQGQRPISYSNYPKTWLQTLEEHQLSREDPAQRAAMTTHNSFTWSEMDQMIKLESRDLAYIAMAKSQGIEDILTIPLHGPNRPSGILSFGTAAGRPLPAHKRAQSIYIAGEIYWTALLIREPVTPLQTRVRLTNRQKECVIYLAKGYTIEETAERLGISRHSVKSHIESSGKTLGARRQPHIVAKAIYYRQIDPSDVV